MRLLLAITASACLQQARSDVLSDWAKTTDSYVKQNVPRFFGQLRASAMVRVAQFDAVNAVVGGYTPYALNVIAPGASAEAAAAQAAYTVLTNISRANIAALNAALAASLDDVPDGPAKENGVRLGQLAAETIIRLRGADNPNLDVPPPALPATPGNYRTTPPSFSAPGGMQARYLVPWTMRSASQFRPVPPPALSSAVYTRDYQEIMAVGSRAYANRTAAEADSAILHDNGEDYLTGATANLALPLLESARRGALLAMVAMDTSIQVFEAKYAYNFWRPVTAIRAGATDGNDDTVGDSTWSPFRETHNHPEYPSQLVAYTAGVLEILTLLHGDGNSFIAVSSDPAQTRSFNRFSDYVNDAITARVIGGTHFRNSCNVAAALGRDIARHAFQHFLRPVPRLQPGPSQPGEFRLLLRPGMPVRYSIEKSSDLVQWLPWQTNTYGAITVSDTNIPGTGSTFYRVAVQE